MKTPRASIILFIVLLITSCTQKNASLDTKTDPIASMDSLTRSYVASIEKLDGASITAHLSSDVIRHMDGRSTSFEEMKERYKTVFKRIKKIETDVKKREIYELGPDKAICYSEILATITFTNEEQQSRMSFTTSIGQKTNAGWKIIYIHEQHGNIN